MWTQQAAAGEDGCAFLRVERLLSGLRWSASHSAEMRKAGLSEALMWHFHRVSVLLCVWRALVMKSNFLLSDQSCWRVNWVGRVGGEWRGRASSGWNNHTLGVKGNIFERSPSISVILFECHFPQKHYLGLEKKSWLKEKMEAELKMYSPHSHAH